MSKPRADVTPAEAAVAGLLHDIGKLAQRAHPNEDALRELYRGDLGGTEAAILPLHQGRYTHRHALWSDAFFRSHATGVRWPEGLDGSRIEAIAVRHHNPRSDDPGDWIVAEADRLASGLERKDRDAAEDVDYLSFRERQLRALWPQVILSEVSREGTTLHHSAVPLSAQALLPEPQPAQGQSDRYTSLWRDWCDGFGSLAPHRLSARRFERALLGLSERLLWAVPSSTVDQPDVSLHDHARAVAAIAAALSGWHAAHDAWSVEAVRDRRTPKFRLATVDLSGIQTALLRLGGAEGAARILRARSLLMAMTVEAALQLLLERFDLPWSSVLLHAGGKAELVLPDLPDLAARLDAVREELDRWMIAHWQGDLALVVAAGPPFAAERFLERGAQGAVADGYREERQKLAAALDAAKLRPFSGWREKGLIGSGVIDTATFDDRPDGVCHSCAVRPATVTSPPGGQRRCLVCDAAYTIGQRIAQNDRSDGLAILSAEAQQGEQAPPALPGGLRLAAWSARGADAVVSYAFNREDLGSAVYRPRAHVPLLRDPDDARYRHAGVSTGNPDGEATPKAGDLMTFAHIAAEALEVLEGGRIVGRDLLAIIKADVDRLGRIFAEGLRGDRSPARIAQLSRLIEAYFTERLPWLLAQTADFRPIYTVYAGGDDLLLVSPWRAAMPFAVALREDFGTFSGDNPDITLSAGIAFVHPKHPLASAVETAEEALERAKAAGRNRLGLFDRVLSWDAARATLELAEALNAVVREGLLPPTVLHRMRWFAARRAMAEQGDDQAADWNPKWRYHESRLFERTEARSRDRLAATLRDALPPPGQAQPADAELAITIALWRNR